MNKISQKTIDIHKANVVGLGAEKFVSGLIKQLLNVKEIDINIIYISAESSVKEFHKFTSKPIIVDYVFGVLSRLIEIICWRFFRKQENEILVLGDLPLNTSARQYVLCHQSLMFKKFLFGSKNFFKFLVFRFVFKAFLKKGDVVLVQSDEMAKNIRRKINSNVDVRVIDITSNFFGWPEFNRTKKEISAEVTEGLKLFYPSAFYPHKNHHFLGSLELPKDTEVLVTIAEDLLPINSNSITCLGNITRDEVYKLYREIDALLFLSSNESLGMPILEAVRCNLPVICPYAEYSKNLYSENCFYFDLADPSSLLTAIASLKEKLSEGWWPNWDFHSVYRSNGSILIEDIILTK